MVKLSGVFSQLQSPHILVIGDFLLDTYTIGKAKRISPEAPVAVVHVQREEYRPGGAGNVVLNLISLGAKVTSVGRCGPDKAGNLLLDALKQEQVNIQGIFVQSDYQTPEKNRVLADNQQIVRIDKETLDPIPELLEQQVIESLSQLIQGVDLIAISDYGKGFLSRTLLSALIDLANRKNIAVITDPKGTDFSKYNGTTILKPNLGEAYQAANMSSDAVLDHVAQRLHKNIDAQHIMITRSEKGISLFQKNGERYDFPVKMREIKDVTGAGDTVLATLSYALANKLNLHTSIQLSNVAAGIAIERFGCARISLSDLAMRLLEEDAKNKIFDDDHLYAFKEAVKGEQLIVLSLSQSSALTAQVFRWIRQKAANKNKKIIIQLNFSNPDPDYVNLLASLHEVNFIFIGQENLKALSLAISPEEVYVENSGCFHKINSIQEIACDRAQKGY